MRVGMDYRSARHGRGGIAFYARELAAALAARPGLDVRLYAKQWRRQDPPPFATVGAPAGAHLVGGRLPAKALGVLARAGVAADTVLGGVDVFHHLDYARLPVRRAVEVATIHDVLFERLPECYTPAMLEGLRRTTRLLVSRAACLLVPSRRTAEDLAHAYDVSPARITVVPHGVPQQGTVASPAEPPAKPYVFAPGTLEPRKNHVRLLEAFARLRADHPALELRIAGARGWMDAPILEAIARTPGAVYEGAVDTARWRALLGGAEAVAYPSLGEGFGLPVLEALAAGRPVLVGANTTAEDIAGGHAEAVDPRAVDALEAGLRAVLEPAADGASAARRAHAATFTWARAAEATHAVYASALAGAPCSS